MGNTLHKVIKWCTKGRGLFCLLSLCFAGSLHAQHKVSGVVSDEKGMTIPGVNVTVKGTQNGVATGLDGDYTIEVPENGTLVFSFIGFTTEEVAVKGKTKINVKLAEASKTLDEVVVIGYGTQKKEDLNSSVSSIRTKDIENLKQTSVDQMIQGKAAGVSVSNNSGAPGSAVSIRVRGTTSISGTNEPLYIIDGVPVSGDATGKSMSGRPMAANDFGSSGDSGNNAVSPLSMINPNDILSIDILKDASATAIYGSRGANGVIIITTKSGKKGSGKLSYEGYTTAATIYKKLDMMDLRQYARHQNELSPIFGFADSQLRPEFAHPELLGKGTDWQDAVFQTAIGKSHQLSFSGGSENTSYYISGGLLDQEGTQIGSGFKRYTAKINLDTKVKDWLRVGVNTNAGVTNENITINQSYSGIISNMLQQTPDVPVRNPDGSFAGSAQNSSGVYYFNPVAEALTKQNKLIRKNFMGNAYAEAEIIKGLKYRIEASANTEFSENHYFVPTYSFGIQNNPIAFSTERNQNWYSVNIKNLLTYDNTFGKHHVTLLAGQEANDSHWEGNEIFSTGFLANDPHTVNLADANSFKVTGYKGSGSIASLFGRVIYDFGNKYGVSASVRSDRSSRFDPSVKDKQTGYFPSVAGSWKLSNEPFMEATKKYVDNIKFRIGYGETGNQQIPQARYSATLTQQNSGLGAGFLPSNFPNPNLTWESMQQTNFGLDFSLFSSRLSASIDVYSKKSKDFLFQVPLPAFLTGGEGFYGGMDAPYSNLGSMKNNGYDITLTYNSKGELQWNSTLVFSHYKNQLTSIQNGLVLTQPVNLNGFMSYDVTNTVVGQPIGMFYGYVSEGIVRNAADAAAAPQQFGQAIEAGDIKYKDVNGDGVVNELDKTLIGNPHPKFTFGFTNNFHYKNWDASIFIQGSYGNDIMNLTYRNGVSNSSLYTNYLTDAANYWSPTNPNAALPRPVGSISAQNNLISTRWIEDGSYARLQNVTLGYSLPSSLISKIKLSRMRIYGSVQNLYTLTNYRGYDPEVGSYNQNQLLTGIDNGRYPTPRTYSVGVNVEF